MLYYSMWEVSFFLHDPQNMNLLAESSVVCFHGFACIHNLLLILYQFLSVTLLLHSFPKLLLLIENFLCFSRFWITLLWLLKFISFPVSQSNAEKQCLETKDAKIWSLGLAVVFGHLPWFPVSGTFSYFGSFRGLLFNISVSSSLRSKFSNFSVIFSSLNIFFSFYHNLTNISSKILFPSISFFLSCSSSFILVTISFTFLSISSNRRIVVCFGDSLPHSRLLNYIEKKKLTFLGHIVRRDGLGKDLIIGMVFGKRKRGRPKNRYKDNIRELTKLSMMQIYRKTKDRREWRLFVKDATADQPNDLPV